MTTTIAIATRELRERKRIFAMAAALAIVPFAVSLVPAAAGQREYAIGLVATVLAVAVAWGTALVLGSTVVSREIAENRFSFYLAKPISPAAIWAGKSIGALVTSIVCSAIIVGPAAAAAWSPVEAGWALVAAMIAAGAIVVFFASHVVSSMIRSRSAWIAIDFALAAVTGVAMYLMVRPLLIAGATTTLVRVSIVLAAGVFVAVVVSPVLQIARGRADVRGSHAALSRVLWTVIGAVMLVTGGYVLWLVTPSPDDVRVYDLGQSATGAALVAGGRGEGTGYQTAFIVDPASGKYHRLSYPLLWGATWSRDGRVVAFVQPTAVSPFRRADRQSDRQPVLQTQGDPRGSIFGLTARPEIFTSVDGGPPRGTGLPITAGEFVLSDDGSRLAIVKGGALSVYDLPTGRLLASARGFREHGEQRMFFVTPDRLRVYEHAARGGRLVALTVSELDVSSRSLVRTEAGSVPAEYFAISVSGDATRMLIRSTGTIADARTGRAIATLATDGLKDSRASMLHDGSVVIASADGEASRLRLFTRDGAPAGEVIVPRPRAQLVGETTDGKLIVLGTRRRPDDAGAPPAMFVIDRATAVLERTLDGVFGPPPRRDRDPRVPRFAAGAPLVGSDADRRLIVWSARTGQTRPFPSN